MVLVLVLLHRALFHLMAAVVTDHERCVHQREPLFFVELRLLTKLFYRVAKDAPFASLTSRCYPGSESPDPFRSLSSVPSILFCCIDHEEFDEVMLGLDPLVSSALLERFVCSAQCLSR